MRYLSLLLLLICSFLQTGRSAPPLVLPLNPYYQDTYGLFGGLSYSYDDDLMLDSMTASASMNVLKKTEAAMENLRKLTDPLVCAKLSAPGGMQRNLLLTLYWLAEADMAGADVEQVLQEISRRGYNQATPADSTMAEVLLFNYHTARHLGILSFSCLVQLGQGLPPSIPESDNNPDNRLAFAIPPGALSLAITRGSVSRRRFSIAASVFLRTFILAEAVIDSSINSSSKVQEYPPKRPYWS